MANRNINIAIIAEIAATLQHLNRQVVFVGGAVISLYANDPAPDEVRPTDDVDIALHIVTLNDWQQTIEKLLALGFYPDPERHTINSYRYKNIPVDIMSAAAGPWGPTNRWYKPGFENLWKANAEEQTVYILSAPCFLATKFEAFHNRGKDYRTSHDMEDIIYVLDNRTTIVEETAQADPSVRNFLIHELDRLITTGILEEVLMAHINPLMLKERIPLVKQKIKQILNP
ncbi:MAG: nucleotidyl transferase AbiEii/AbiGii toxin family protein [Chitinophagaceae bacterium]|nr:nucleotidyl transferase AbiEii/AbiGii toxin family protein [Chitinophagaceae bacterium]MBX3254267.1 nucleotidyl transferase AbiEii/AbiGii toxin family protein [Chitinophagaceae bacterium]